MTFRMSLLLDCHSCFLSCLLLKSFGYIILQIRSINKPRDLSVQISNFQLIVQSLVKGVKQTFTTGLCTLLFVLLGAIAVSAQSDPEATDVDTMALDVLEEAASFLENQDRFSFSWFVSYDEIVDGREKLTYTRSGRNTAKRDEGFYSYTVSGEDTREYFFDGASFVVNDVEENAYAAVPFNGTFNALIDRLEAEYDIQLPIGKLMSDTLTADLLSDAESAAYVDLTTVGGRPAHHLAFSNYERDWQIWVSTEVDRPEVIMMVGTDPYQQGWPQYRAYFTDWNFSPELPEDLFTYIPDAEADRMTWPKTPSQMDELRGSSDYSSEPAPDTGSE